jgi:pimeloyl-ACP methyl ester carboxylesterase
MTLETKTKPVDIKTGRVTTEGDTLFFEVREPAQATIHPPLLMIAPGGGDGWQYSYVADILADEYKVITYDRRANGRSTMNSPVNFEISQQSRDAVAVLHAAGEQSAFVFGNSSGAVIALDIAKTQPQICRAVVAHEAPLPRVLPDSHHWQRFFANVNAMAYNLSPSLAALRFMLGIHVPVGKLIQASRGVNKHSQASSEPYLRAKIATEILVKHELLPVTNYLPDNAQIQKNGVRVYLAVGEWGLERKTWYVKAAQILSEQLGSELVIFPGHHGSFMDLPEEWAAVLRKILQNAETKLMD